MQASNHGITNHQDVKPVHPRFGPGIQLRRINGTVCGVLAVFFFLLYVDVFLIIIPWLSYSVPGITNLGVLAYTAGSALYCYLFCVLLDPGSVPHGWHPDEEHGAVTEVKRKDGGHRFCQKCQQYKPPRSHHCRVCQRCVLRMDHHCPWTNNCIGHSNYRAFILFLVYVTAAAIHTMGLIVAHVLHVVQSSKQERIVRTGLHTDPIHLHHHHSSWMTTTWVWAALQTLAFIVCLPVTISLVMLLIWSLHLLIHNQTTIEYQEGVHASVQGGAEAVAYEHPYDLGTCNNLHEAFGDNPIDWCWPPRTVTKGGTRYQTIWDQRILGID